VDLVYGPVCSDLDVVLAVVRHDVCGGRVSVSGRGDECAAGWEHGVLDRYRLCVNETADASMACFRRW
jgi:hypothetical protein